MRAAPQQTPDCRRAATLIAADGADPPWLTQHLHTCPHCQRRAQAIAAVRQAVLTTAEPGLDDLARIRLQTRLRQSLDALPTSGTRGRQTWRWAALGLASAAAGLVLFLAIPRQHPSMTPPVATPQVAPGILRPHALLGQMATEMRVPARVETARGAGSPAAAPIDRAHHARPLRLGMATSALRVSAGSVARATVSPSGRLALIGPGQLTATHSADGGALLHLPRGLLLVEVPPGGGRTFRVQTPRLAVTVTGTCFAVDARDPRRPSVAVSRGSVRAQIAGARPLTLNAGQALRADSASREGLSAEIAALLREHEVAIPPPTVGAGTLALGGDPRAARVLLGDALLGVTPLLAQLPVGSARLHLSAAGYLPTTIEVQIQEGRETRLGFVLTPRTDLPSPPPVPIVDRRAETAPPSSMPPRTPHRAAHTPAPGARPATLTPAPGARPATLTPAPGARPATLTPAPARSVGGTAEALYVRAEAHLRDGEPGTAAGILTELVRGYPADPRTPLALFELARLAHETGDRARARRHLAQLLHHPAPGAIADPATFLLCRIEAMGEKPEPAITCFQRFRRSFPGSPHDEAALWALARLTFRQGGCQQARRYGQEILRATPPGRYAARAASLLRNCPRAPR